MLDILRVPEDQERTGLDWVKHKEPAYPIGKLLSSGASNPIHFRWIVTGS